MQRKSVIICIPLENFKPICRGNFKKLCDELKFPYHTLKTKKFPIYFRDYVIHKVDFK